MSDRQKRSRNHVSTLIFAGATALSVWMGAAYVAATSTPADLPASHAAAPSQMARS